MLQDIAMALLFGVGYMGIIFEESLAFNKSGVGLLMAVSLWVIRSIGVRREFTFLYTTSIIECLIVKVAGYVIGRFVSLQKHTSYTYF